MIWSGTGLAKLVKTIKSQYHRGQIAWFVILISVLRLKRVVVGRRGRKKEGVGNRCMLVIRAGPSVIIAHQSGCKLINKLCWLEHWGTAYRTRRFQSIKTLYIYIVYTFLFLVQHLEKWYNNITTELVYIYLRNSPSNSHLETAFDCNILINKKNTFLFFSKIL